jgi:hypothetical protein
VTEGSITLYESSAFWTDRLTLESGGNVTATNRSTIFVNGTVEIQPGSKALFSDRSVFNATGAYLAVTGASLLANKDSSIRLFNGSVIVLGCRQIPDDRLSAYRLTERPCSLVVNDGSRLFADTMGSLAVFEKGLVAALGGASIIVANDMGCSLQGAILARDGSKFSSTNNMYTSTGCSISAANSSEIRVGDAIILSTFVSIDRSNCTSVSALDFPVSRSLTIFSGQSRSKTDPWLFLATDRL